MPQYDSDTGNIVTAMVLLQGEVDGLVEFSISINEDNSSTYFEEVRQLYYRVCTACIATFCSSCLPLFGMGGGIIAFFLFFCLT